jgi:hypothetical protein
MMGAVESAAPVLLALYVKTAIAHVHLIVLGKAVVITAVAERVEAVTKVSTATTAAANVSRIARAKNAAMTVAAFPVAFAEGTRVALQVGNVWDHPPVLRRDLLGTM